MHNYHIIYFVFFHFLQKVQKCVSAEVPTFRHRRALMMAANTVRAFAFAPSAASLSRHSSRRLQSTQHRRGSRRASLIARAGAVEKVTGEELEVAITGVSPYAFILSTEK